MEQMNRKKAQSVSWAWILAVLVAVFGVVLNVPVARAGGTVWFIVLQVIRVVP
jgi:ABC-type branched-subunit amino acid transport system permease subunit